MQYTFDLSHPIPSNGNTISVFFGQSRPYTAADLMTLLFIKNTLLMHPQWMQCNLYNIYQIQCILYLSDVIQVYVYQIQQKQCLPVDVWCRGRFPWRVVGDI